MIAKLKKPAFWFGASIVVGGLAGAIDAPRPLSAGDVCMAGMKCKVLPEGDSCESGLPTEGCEWIIDTCKGCAPE